MSSNNSEHIHDKPIHGHNELTRQMTLQLSPDQYERLFFQPSAPKGDLAKRLGNPTLLGLLGFLIPFSSTIFCLLQFQGSTPSSLASVSGTFYFLGGIAMNVAGIAEFILGNSFPMAVFMIFGCHWVNIGYLNDPVHGIVSSYAAGGEPGALAQLYNAGQGNYNVVMTLVTFIFLLGSLRINIPFVIVFFTLIFVFSFFAAGFYQLRYDPSAAGLAHAVYYFKIAGGFGFVTMIMGWYLAIITVCASTGVPCPLPVFDLSQKVFAHNTNAQKGEHAGTVTQGNA
ncbi:GPR1/FUN34/YaaH-class plasma membrane protein-like protein [Stipitochalara longipes BDJ]|nr:GPR1/FUN34/YaaH-class plasma membrane protein-like protein [Stipitochalara longipes BDJ]